MYFVFGVRSASATVPAATTTVLSAICFFFLGAVITCNDVGGSNTGGAPSEVWATEVGSGTQSTISLLLTKLVYNASYVSVGIRAVVPMDVRTVVAWSA